MLLDKEKQKDLLKAMGWLGFALLSFFGLSQIFTNPKFLQFFMQFLEEKQGDVLTFLASTAAASAGIALIPSDATTPIAQAIMDLSGYLIIIMAVIYIEKYILVIAGYAMCYVIIPLFSIIMAFGFLIEKQAMFDYIKKIAVKILIMGIAVLLLVPASVGTGELIEYASDLAQIEVAEIEEFDDYEEQGFWEKLKNNTANGLEKAKSVLSDFIENIAVMLITSCAIPILVLYVLLKLIKALFGLDLTKYKAPKISRGINKIKDYNKEEKSKKEIDTEEIKVLKE